MAEMADTLGPNSGSQNPEKEEEIVTSNDLNKGDLGDLKPQLNTLKTEKTFEYEHAGLTVHFPHPPHDSQIKMMAEILSGVQNGENCLLESPPGTGKTAAVLCSLLAWQQQQKQQQSQAKELNSSSFSSETCSPTANCDCAIKKPPKIYYSTRTRAQVNQVVSQFQKTAYSHIPMAILGGGEKQEQVFSEKENDEVAHPETTSENLFEFGRGKKSHAEAQIIFCTYKHLLCKFVREAHEIECRGNVFVFDEAHNVEGVCTDEASFSLSLHQVEEIRGLLSRVIERSKEKEKNGEEEKEEQMALLQNLCEAFSLLSNWLHKFRSRKIIDKKDEETVYDLNDYFGNFRANATLYENPPPHDADGPTLAKRARISKEEEEESKFDSSSFFLNLMNSFHFGPRKLLQFQHLLNNLSQDILLELELELLSGKNTVKIIKSFLSTLQIIFHEEQTQNQKEFPRLRDFEIKLEEQTGKQINNVKLSLLCVNPSFSFEKMKECRSVIMTSSTLSPLEAFSPKFGVPFQRALATNPVLIWNRAFVSVIQRLKSSPPTKDMEIKFDSYKGREAQQLFEEIGEIILSICKTVPNGVLVFGPSKDFMSTLKNGLEKTRILEEIKQVKKGGIFWETDGDSKADSNAGADFPKGKRMEKYGAAAKNPDPMEGAVLFAHCRGRLSEGWDFTDGQARAVITLGIPCLRSCEENVVAMRSYYNKRSEEEGEEWYYKSGCEALSHALGRCTRHSCDWGVLCMIDSRLTQRRWQERLSNWVGKGKNDGSAGSLEEIIPQLQEFVQRASQGNFIE